MAAPASSRRTRHGRVSRLRVPDRVRTLPWRVIAPALLFLLALVAIVPPLRVAAANATANVLLTVASPLAPPIKGFDRLPGTTRVLAADGSLLAELDRGQRREPVRLKALPAYIPHAVMAAEDAKFYEHAGVDLTAIARATIRTFQGQQQGGSTITQQLAKLNYTGSQRTIFRKLREVLYARRLEDRYTKDQLLERYLNQVYFGDGAYGIATASDAYFGVPPGKLTAAQAAVLAGKIRSPEGLDPRRRAAQVKARRDQVLRNMAGHGWLREPFLSQALAAPMDIVARREVSSGLKAPHFVRLVEREAMGLDALGGSKASRGKELFTGGYTIKTTLDPKAFDAAVASARARLGRDGDPTVGLITVQPGDGAIRNLFGGLDDRLAFDVTTQGRRQPGSSFKPFVYLAALADGIDPRSRVPADSPMTLDWKGSPFTVSNYEGHGGGLMTIDDALVDSVNTVFAQVGLEVEPQNVVRTAEKAGIRPGIRPVPAVALGGLNEGVSPLEMAAAYATFAAKGVYATPYAIASIEAPGRGVVYEHKVQAREAFDAREVGVLNHPMQGVVASGTATAARIGRPVAGKTGTTQNHTNAWFIGYTPQLATAVWVGHPDKDTPMTNVHGVKVTGGSFPAQIFADTMKVALRGVRVLPIPTVSPESLSLRPLGESSFPTLEAPATSAPSSTTTSSATPTTLLLAPSTTVPAETTTTQTPETGPPKRQTTTTAASDPTTTSPP